MPRRGNFDSKMEVKVNDFEDVDLDEKTDFDEEKKVNDIVNRIEALRNDVHGDHAKEIRGMQDEIRAHLNDKRWEPAIKAMQELVRNSPQKKWQNQLAESLREEDTMPEKSKRAAFRDSLRAEPSQANAPVPRADMSHQRTQETEETLEER